MKKTLLLLSCVVLWACQVENINYREPIMFTFEPINIQTNSAVLGGAAASEGGKDILEYGLVWSTSTSPTINDNKIIKGSRLGEFQDLYTIFEPGTVYYYSAYGINDEGIGYGNVYSFTTTKEAPCAPEPNYFKVETPLTGLQNGFYSSTGLDDGDTTIQGSDYFLKANTTAGFGAEIQVHFDGNYENLLSGIYPIVSDLNEIQKVLGKTVVTLRHRGNLFYAKKNDEVYVKRTENKVSIVLCDLEFEGSINFQIFTATITTEFSVE